MKSKFRILIFSLLLVFPLGSCKGQKSTQVISIGYHSDNCQECNTLKAKMKVMNRKFLFKPIVFIKYDKTNDKTKASAEEELAEWGMLEIAQHDDGLKYVILYDSKSKKMLQTINYNDDVDLIKSKISQALKDTRQ